jgi:dipeptidyl-peptidase-4
VRNLFKADDPLEGYRTGEVRLGTVKSADGLYDNYYRMFLPANFDPSKKYPVILYVYGGPHSQMVTDTWLGSVRMWEMLMAERGYIVYVQDNRGTEHRGAAFEKAINRQCGQAEMADQMVGIDWLRTLPYVDASRIGVHGWSYGGFMTITLITNHPDVFKVGVAGGPVIDWKWYEVMYGERYMDNPETNPEGFEKTSLINKATDLKGKLLICQGAIDNTVVWEHSLSFIQECIENNVQVDYFPYPVSEHNVTGPWREHLMQKVTDYFEDYL